MKCPICGSEQNEELFCGICGHDLAEEREKLKKIELEKEQAKRIEVEKIKIAQEQKAAPVKNETQKKTVEDIILYPDKKTAFELLKGNLVYIVLGVVLMCANAFLFYVAQMDIAELEDGAESSLALCLFLLLLVIYAKHYIVSIVLFCMKKTLKIEAIKENFLIPVYGRFRMGIALVGEVISFASFAALLIMILLMFTSFGTITMIAYAFIVGYYIFLYIRLCEVCGKAKWFGFGMFFLPIIFLPVLYFQKRRD